MTQKPPRNKGIDRSAQDSSTRNGASEADVFRRTVPQRSPLKGGTVPTERSLTDSLTRRTQGIETTYQGVLYRSRLEARWAVMFDYFGWPFEYEPIDLGGYIPDFVLLFPAGPVLAEIKPEFGIAELEAAAAEKIDHSGWRSKNLNDALIFGATCQLEGCYGEEVLSDGVRQAQGAAVVRQAVADWEDGRGWDAARWHWCDACRRVSVHAEALGWHCTLCGAYDGDRYITPLSLARLEDHWINAGTRVRWEPNR